MKKFWAKDIEYKALVISSLATLLVFLATTVCFWFNHYEIPLAGLLGGGVVTMSWLVLLINKKRQRKGLSLDVFLIYFRLVFIALLAALFTYLQLQLSLVIVSPIFLIVFYLIISMITLTAYLKKETDNV